MPDVQALRFEDDGETPNNPRLPLLLYRAAVTVAGERDPALPFERAFARNGWPDGWRNGIHPFAHFHTTAHEALGIARGRATVRFGGARGKVLSVEAGDVVVLPAGTGHQRLDSTPDLLVVGAYPRNARVDQHRPGGIEHAAAVANIAEVPVPDSDPVHGSAGPLVALWST